MAERQTVVQRQHGTRARYVHGPDEDDQPGPCRCYGCSMANAEWTLGWEAKRRRGLSSFVDNDRAELVRRHVRALQDGGLGTRRICEVAGVSRSSLQAFLEGRDRIRHATADALIKLRVDTPVADGVPVDAGPTWERVNALLAAGYTKRWIAEQIGQGKALQLGKERVTAVNARLVDEVFKRFIGLPPPLKGTRSCCFAVGAAEQCHWTPLSPWFCPDCGYGRHQCPPPLA